MEMYYCKKSISPEMGACKHYFTNQVQLNSQKKHTCKCHSWEKVYIQVHFSHWQQETINLSLFQVDETVSRFRRSHDTMKQMFVLVSARSESFEAEGK